MANVIIYCRVSSKGQLEGGGLNSQEVACKQYCERNGYQVVNTFYDAFTGGDLDRPGLNKLFDFIDENNKRLPKEPIEIFIAEDISRIARDYNVHLDLTKGLMKRGVRYETVNMKFEDTPAGKMIEGILALNAEFFRRNNQKQVIDRMESRLLDGYRPFDYPIGYKTEKAPAGGKILVLDEPNASIIKEALLGYAKGLFNNIKEVADFLQRKGLDASRHKKKGKGMTFIHQSLAQRILTQILYTGHLEYSKITRDKDGIIKKHRNISLRKARHEGLIDMETYERIQEKLSGKRKYTHEVKIINDDYPLRGYLVCSCCGLNMTSGKSRSKNGKQIAYYQSNKNCVNHSKSISADKLHQEMESRIKSLGVKKSFLSMMKILIIQEHQERVKDKLLNKKNIQRDITKIDTEIDNLVNAISITTSPLVQKKLEQKVEDCEYKKNELTEHLNKLNNSEDINKVLDIAFEIMANPSYIWKNGTIDQRQMLIRLLFNQKIPVDYATGTYGTLPISALFLPSMSIKDLNYELVEMTRSNSCPKSELSIYYHHSLDLVISYFSL